MAVKQILKDVIVSYCHVLEARPTPDGSEEKYSGSLIMAKDNPCVKTLQANILAVAKEKFGTKAAAMLKSGKLRSPLRDGDTDREDDPAYAGKLFINASSKRKPQVVDRQVMPIVDEDEVYSGVTANVSIALFPYDVNGNKGVGCGLNNMQVTHKGPRLDGAASAAEEFEELEDEDGEDELD